MEIDKTKIAKFAVSAVVVSGTSKIVKGVVENNTNPERLTDKVALYAGVWVLSGIVAEKAKKHTDAAIDNAVTWWDENVKPRLQK